MFNFHQELTKLLKQDDRFLDQEGELMKSVVIEHAWKTDRALVTLLLQDAEIKHKFFDEIAGHLVFNVTKFVEFVQDKNFLNDSWTKYKNKVGLNIRDKFLQERGEVALVWPYKDCVLEGGMTDEETKRKEIFFNEVLAQDEIDRLLDPKVLTGWVRHTKKGTEKVTELKRGEDGALKENLIIKGNNLLALHSLKEQFTGKVKLIYIDPPYNTENNHFGYNDNFNHSSWLTFMRNRLETAKELLSNNGAIFINIDDDECHYLKVLGDEVFGRENFVANVIWQKKYSPQNDAKWFSDNHDHILVFAKQKEIWRPNLLERTEKQNHYYKHDDKDGKGLYRLDNVLVKTFSESGVFGIKNPNTGKEYFPPQGSCWRFNKDTAKIFLKENKLYFGRDGKGAPQLKRYLLEVKQGVTPLTMWFRDEVGDNQEAKKEFKNLGFDTQQFSTPKPERLLQRVIELGSNDGEIVLDFFAGSGTSGAVAHKMNRQYILIEQLDYIHDLPEARLKKVVAGEQGGISEAVDWKGGGDFIYCELARWNENFVERIRDAKETKELLKIWEEMKNPRKSFLNYNVDLKQQDAAMEEFKTLALEKQKKVLAHLLDKNQLYVNLSEIEDTDYAISPADQKLNGEFYKS
jgi:adenine-specific DNA-methyltransferase